jgi:hypothetical protein
MTGIDPKYDVTVIWRDGEVLRQRAGRPTWQQLRDIPPIDPPKESPPAPPKEDPVDLADFL